MAKGKEGTGNMSVRLDNDVIDIGRIVAAHTGKPMNQLFSEILRPVLKQMERAEIEKKFKALEAEAKKPKGKE